MASRHTHFCNAHQPSAWIIKYYSFSPIFAQHTRWDSWLDLNSLLPPSATLEREKTKKIAHLNPTTVFRKWQLLAQKSNNDCDPRSLKSFPQFAVGVAVRRFNTGERGAAALAPPPFCQFISGDQQNKHCLLPLRRSAATPRCGVSPTSRCITVAVFSAYRDEGGPTALTRKVRTGEKEKKERKKRSPEHVLGSELPRAPRVTRLSLLQVV